MRIKKISIFLLKIPFCMPISHNLAERSESEAIITIAEDDNGLQGFGEGTPRQFVTGETLPSCLRAAKSLAGRLLQAEAETFTSLTSLLRALGNSEEAQANPAAWCALELAGLDLWARRARVPLWRLFTELPPRESFTYSAILPLLPEHFFTELLELILRMEFRYVKVKIRDRKEGIARLKLVRKMLGEAVDLRVDANGAFSSAAACAFLQEAVPLDLCAFEQPVPKGALPEMKTVSECAAPVPIIADESCCSMNDVEDLIKQRACQGLNIRLAKCGGLLQSLDLWDRAREDGLFCQIGCHVGETAILSAAGRQLAVLRPDHVFLEGSLSRFVLQEDLVTEDITFGRQGRAPLLNTPGLGVTVDRQRLARWTEPV